VRTAFEPVRPGGRVVLGGIPDSDATTFRASLARRKGLTIAMVRRMNEVYPRAIDLAARGVVALDPLVSSRTPQEITRLAGIVPVSQKNPKCLSRTDAWLRACPHVSLGKVLARSAPPARTGARLRPLGAIIIRDPTATPPPGPRRKW
jgi:hypothetical protein